MTENRKSPQARTRRLGRVDDVRRLLALPKTTVYELARKGTLPGVVRVGRRVLFDTDKVKAWVDDGPFQRRSLR